MKIVNEFIFKLNENNMSSYSFELNHRSAKAEYDYMISNCQSRKTLHWNSILLRLNF
jgi:hypothetical protein